MSSKTPIGHSLVVDSRSSSAVDVCDRILFDLKKWDFKQEDVFAIHLALEEAFINAAKHGNKMDESKEIKIDYSISSDKVEIFVKDQGEGFDPDKVPDPRCGDNIYKTEGRGLFLIRSYMDEVEFNEQGNQIRLVRYTKKDRKSEN